MPDFFEYFVDDLVLFRAPLDQFLDGLAVGVYNLTYFLESVELEGRYLAGGLGVVGLVLEFGGRGGGRVVLGLGRWVPLVTIVFVDIHVVGVEDRSRAWIIHGAYRTLEILRTFLLVVISPRNFFDF